MVFCSPNHSVPFAMPLTHHHVCQVLNPGVCTVFDDVIEQGYELSVPFALNSPALITSVLLTSVGSHNDGGVGKGLFKPSYCFLIATGLVTNCHSILHA